MPANRVALHVTLEQMHYFGTCTGTLLLAWFRKELLTFMPDSACVEVEHSEKLRGGRVLLIKILLPRVARQETVCQLDEGFQLYHPPFREVAYLHL